MRMQAYTVKMLKHVVTAHRIRAGSKPILHICRRYIDGVDGAYYTNCRLPLIHPLLWYGKHDYRPLSEFKLCERCAQVESTTASTPEVFEHVSKEYRAATEKMAQEYMVIQEERAQERLRKAENRFKELVDLLTAQKWGSSMLDAGHLVNMPRLRIVSPSGQEYTVEMEE